MISIIVPVFNESDRIEDFITRLKVKAEGDVVSEIIVVDGGSNDGSYEKICSIPGIKAIRSEKGRAKQMNAGAVVAKGDILYFLHADTKPPKGFLDSIIASKARAGCFRLKFGDTDSFLMKLGAFFTRFKGRLLRGGDQSLFVRKDLFEKLGGYNENYEVYEDVELILRLENSTQFAIIPDDVETSARRFHENGILRLYFHFLVIHLMAIKKYPPNKLSGYYKKYIS